jgi:diguanylate cyclase (GGDEF)-like protein
MNAIVKNTQISKKLYKRFSSVIKPFDVVQQKLNEIKDKNKEKLKLEAIICPLTGALNHEGLCKLFDNIVPSALKKVTIIFITIDRIDDIQEKLSQKAFGKVLKKFVTEINTICRNTDIISRWNSKDFVLVCPETTHKEAVELALEIRDGIRSCELIKDMKMSCSTGVTQVYGTELHELIAKTRQSIYRIKHKDGNKSYVSTVQNFDKDKDKKNHIMKSVHVSDSLPEGVLNRVELHKFLNKIAPVDLKRTCTIFIEIIGFDEIYKQHGQAVSMDVLNSVTTEVRKIGRKWDTLAQWSSTEYIMVCPSTGIYRALDVAKEIQLSIENRIWQNNIKIICNTGAYDSECIDVKANIQNQRKHG